MDTAMFVERYYMNIWSVSWRWIRN